MANNSSKVLRTVAVLRPEEVLAERYDQLRAWAVGLTRGDVSVALDIVHDLYLYVTLAKTDFDRISNLDSYLYKCLRHLHLAHLAQASRNALRQISVADLDSMQFALWASPDSYVLEHQNELRRICHYAISRKDHIKSASFFVLRFFHGYRLQEIADIANLSISVVQPKLSRMRSEIKQYLEDPDDSELVDTRTEDMSWTPVSSPELFRELRTTIMRARNGDCLDASELVAHYSALIPKAISCALLSHIASCERCLSIIDQHFRRPTLRQREPLDGIDSGAKRKFQKAGANVARFAHGEMFRLVSSHLQDVYEHRPRLLSIAVNGKIIASHEVQAQRSTQSARIERPEQISCVEVFSEQDVRLALILLEDLPPQGPTTRVEHVELSDGRWIDVRLTFDSFGLNSEVTYFDPMLPTLVEETIREDDSKIVPIHIISSPEHECFTDHDQTVPPENSDVTEVHWKTETKRARSLQAWWSRSRSSVSMSIPDMNPLLASAVILAMASIACFFAWMHGQSKITAGALLDQAKKWDTANSRNAQPGVIYQKVRITTKERTFERTVYRDAQGARHPRRRQLSSEDEQLKNKLASAGVSWDTPLSAVDYAEWRQRSGPTRDDVKRTGEHLLTLTTTALSDNAVLKETFTVRDTDFMGVDRTVELRDTGTVEIAQLNYDVLPWGAVNQDWFEPMPVGAATDAPGGLSQHVPGLSAELELETELAVRYALHGVNADLGEPVEIHLERRRATSVSVSGVVPSVERKQEILAALMPISGVAVRLQTEEEAESRKLPGRVTRAEPLIATAHSPIETELLNSLGDPLEVENFCKHTIAITRDLTAHAWALRHLSERFGEPEVTRELSLSPASRQLLQSMRRDHYRAMSHDISELTTSLGPVLHSIVHTDPEFPAKLPLFDGAEQIQRLTLELVSGSRPLDGNETSEPAKTAQALLAALRGLEITLEEQL